MLSYAKHAQDLMNFMWWISQNDRMFLYCETCDVKPRTADQISQKIRFKQLSSGWQTLQISSRSYQANVAV